MAIKVPYHPNYSKNRDRATSDAMPCVICGKECKNPQWFVHLHEGGQLLVTEEEAATMSEGGDMGGYPIGSDCLRRHPELRPYVHSANKGDTR